jgi:hypothetical protein
VMRQAVRSARVAFGQALRARTLAALGAFAVLSAAALFWARGVPQFTQNFALNLASELVGAFVILFALTPIVRRAQQGGVREHRRLDFDWYLDRMTGAASTARILHTFTRLFAPPFDRRFARTAEAFLRRGGRIQILLLHPDSPAATQRTVELRGHGDVARETRRNLRILDAFRRGLDSDPRGRCQVRLYDAAPSVAIYQWDDRLLASFLPLGGRSGDSAQLEVSTESPLGNFVSERFEELWANSTSLDEYMSMRLMVRADGGLREYTPRFVALDGERFIADEHIVAHLARADDAVRAAWSHAPDEVYRLAVVPEDAPLLAALVARFRDKYDRPEAAFIRLTRD